VTKGGEKVISTKPQSRNRKERLTGSRVLQSAKHHQKNGRAASEKNGGV